MAVVNRRRYNEQLMLKTLPPAERNAPFVQFPSDRELQQYIGKQKQVQIEDGPTPSKLIPAIPVDPEAALERQPVSQDSKSDEDDANIAFTSAREEYASSSSHMSFASDAHSLATVSIEEKAEEIDDAGGVPAKEAEEARTSNEQSSRELEAAPENVKDHTPENVVEGGEEGNGLGEDINGAEPPAGEVVQQDKEDRWETYVGSDGGQTAPSRKLTINGGVQEDAARADAPLEVQDPPEILEFEVVDEE
eukprot:scaffold3551_cov408-Prasinococcus_capsulatus_cf.AAC.26